MPGSKRHEVYYRWVDGSGRVHLTTSLESVPPDERARVEQLVMENAGAEEEALEQLKSSDGRDWLLLGGAGVLAALFAWLVLPRGWRWLPKLVAVALVALLLGGLYLGALRRTTTGGSSAVASPSAIIQDAEQAVEKMRLRHAERDEELRRIQSEPE